MCVYFTSVRFHSRAMNRRYRADTDTFVVLQITTAEQLLLLPLILISGCHQGITGCLRMSPGVIRVSPGVSTLPVLLFHVQLGVSELFTGGSVFLQPHQHVYVRSKGTRGNMKPVAQQHHHMAGNVTATQTPHWVDLLTGPRGCL